MSGKWMGMAVAVCFVAGGGQAAEKVPAVKKLEVKAYRAGEPGDFGKPTVIASAGELAKAVADREAREQIARQVDFGKQQVLMFYWGGSGGDRLSAREGVGRVVFSLERGLTRDFRPHRHFFAVRKGVEYKLPDARR